MLIECLIRREGPTTLVLAQTKYLFTPVPGSKKREPSTSVCDIVTEEHINYLLDPKRKGQFREYNPEQIEQDVKETRAQNNVYLGYSIQKYHDVGYIAIDQRIKNKPRYAGMDGIWKDQSTGLTPFPTEFQAFEWLKEELQFEAQEVEEKPAEVKKEVKSKVS